MGAKTGPEFMSFLSALGHSAPDEILGGETLLHEHQPGPGELQQVCGAVARWESFW